MRTALLLALALGVAPVAQAAEPAIPHTSFTLDNGLTVYLVEDHTTPQAVVVTWYDVGSQDEKPGRTGLAHLFEHLMFKGSKHIPDGKLDILLEGAGGWSNAFTSSDMTVYFDVAASNFLETMLWIEADRMGGLLDTLDQEKLDNQRDVVRNERRQSYENRPYGMSEVILRESLWPAGFGYHWPVIGYHDDLVAASLTDVRRFFQTFYVPANATMVIGGDIDPKKAKALVERYFGWLPKRPKPTPPAYATPAPLKKEVDLVHPDKVQVPRVYLSWRAPAAFTGGEPAVDLAARILGGGKSSRLYERLVFQDRIAQDVSATLQSEVLGSELDVVVTARPGVAPERLVKAVDEEIARLAKEPPTAKELDRVKNARESSFLQQLEPVLWRAIQLAQYSVQAGDPDYLAKDLARYRDVTAPQVSAATKTWLAPERRVFLTISPEKATPSAGEKAPAPKPATDEAAPAAGEAAPAGKEAE